MKIPYYRLIIACCLMCSLPLQAEVVIIVHASNHAEINPAYLKRIFLGKVVYFPGGKTATPLNAESGTELRTAFEQRILRKSDAQVRSYWAKRIFTGKGIPPKEISLTKMVQMVASDPRFIGYTTTKHNLGDSVRVVSQH